MFTIVLFPQIQLLFPEEGLVYDYKLNDAGLNNAEDDLDEDVIREVKYFTSNSKLGNLREGPGNNTVLQDLTESSHQGQIKKAYRNPVIMFQVKSSLSLKEGDSFLP